jgi:hypothetical protein
VNPSVERVDDPGRRAAHLHGLRKVPESVEKATHRRLSGDAAALGAADPVGDSRHHFLARLRQFGANDRGGEILVLPARAFVRAESDARSHAGGALYHRNSSPSGIATSIRQPATIIEEISAGRRREDDGQLA